MTTPLSIALIGAGRIGRVHAETVALRLPGARLAAVADVYLPAAEEVAARYGAARAVADYRPLLEDASVDAVLIASATDTHAEMIEAAAAAGKDIFCEKPIALDLERIDRALDAVERAGVRLQVGFNRRYDPTFRAIQQQARAGAIGEIHLLRITSRDPEPPPIAYVRRSGGIFFDMTIHDFDMARYLVGCEVVAIYAAGGVRVDPAIGEAGDLDTAIVTLHFEDGTLGTIDNSRRAIYGYDQRVELFGSGGMLAAGNQRPDTAVRMDEEGTHSARPLYFFLERYREAYVDEIAAFVRAVQQDRPVEVTGADGRTPVVMAMAATRSAREGRVVRLDEVDPPPAG